MDSFSNDIFLNFASGWYIFMTKLEVLGEERERFVLNVSFSFYFKICRILYTCN